MPLRVLIVPDKFKGSLTARQAAVAIAGGWAETRPDDRLDLLPMADGGEGFGQVLGELLQAGKRVCHTVDAAGRPRAAEWWHASARGTAVVEAAQVNGLALLPAGRFHPFRLDTYGLGLVLRQAEAAGARRIYVGVGGSATNDGGFGLARALGWRFLDGTGREIPVWTGLDRLAKVERLPAPLEFAELIIAVDVANPLLGPEGASRVYGSQKGLRLGDMARAEACLARLAEVMGDLLGEDHAFSPGSGAAGGLGFGLKVFCGGRFRSGGEIFIEFSGLEKRIRETDLVITAEGALDRQSLMGKGVGLVAGLAAQAGKPCLCLAGSLALDAQALPWPGFRAYAIVPRIAPLEEALARPADCLFRLAARVAGDLP
jgi:glycerate kinase